MLVISRKVNERVLVGDSEVSILAIEHGSVRLGIDAAKDIHVKRAELPDRGQRTEDRGLKQDHFCGQCGEEIVRYDGPGGWKHAFSTPRHPPIVVGPRKEPHHD